MVSSEEPVNSSSKAGVQLPGTPVGWVPVGGGGGGVISPATTVTLSRNRCWIQNKMFTAFVIAMVKVCVPALIVAVAV